MTAPQPETLLTIVAYVVAILALWKLRSMGFYLTDLTPHLIP